MHIVEQDLHFLGSNLKGQIRYKTTLHNPVKRCISQLCGVVFVCCGNKSLRSTVIELFTRTYLERRIMLLLMLHPLFPALIACFPASVLMSLVMDQISIAMSTSITIQTDHFFVYRIFERSILFFLNEVQKTGAFVIWRYRFPAAIFAAVRHGVMSVTISDPVKSLKFHAQQSSLN